MQMKTLEYFLAAADYRSFTKAADALFISQQGMSKAIASLEKELGVSLFVRKQTPLELTSEGIVVAKSVNIILREYAAMNNRLRLLFRAKEARSFDSLEDTEILAMPYICWRLLDDILKADLFRYGLGSYAYTTIDYSDVVELIKNDKQNSRLVILAGLPSDKYEQIIDSTRMQFFPLLTTNAVLVGERDIMLSANRTVSPEEIRDIPLVHYRGSVFDQGFEYDNGIYNSKDWDIQYATSAAEVASLLASGQAATVSDTFSIYAMGEEAKKGDYTIRRLNPVLSIYIGIFVGEKVDPTNPRHYFMAHFQKMIKNEYHGYIHQNSVPCPNYTAIE